MYFKDSLFRGKVLVHYSQASANMISYNMISHNMMFQFGSKRFL